MLRRSARPRRARRGSAVMRHVVAAFAFVALCIALYLAAYQMHAIARVWDPVFGAGSERVLDSSVSRAIRRFTIIPDSALGAIAYLAEIILVFLSPKHRWFRILLIANSVALVVAGASLVALQAFVVHAWCLLCLTSAAISFCIAAIAAKDVF